MYNIHCKLYSEQCTKYIVNCTTKSVQWTVYRLELDIAESVLYISGEVYKGWFD